MVGWFFPHTTQSQKTPCSFPPPLPTQLHQPVIQGNRIWRTLQSFRLKSTETLYLCFVSLLPLFISCKVTQSSCQQLKHIRCQEATMLKKTTNPPIHFLTQSCFLSASWVLCDHREIKILAVQSHYRKAVMLPGPAKPQHQHCCFFTSCMTGKPHLPFRSHCSKPEHLSQVPCALRLL